MMLGKVLTRWEMSMPVHSHTPGAKSEEILLGGSVTRAANRVTSPAWRRARALCAECVAVALGRDRPSFGRWVLISRSW